jgi:hypothetical protein
MPASSLAAVLVIALAAQDPAPVQAPPERKLSVTFDLQGNVSVVAQSVTIREILAEWGRKGGTQIVNADRLAGGPIAIPMQFENRPELEVVEALLRQAAGVSIVPRRLGVPGASRFESIYILATSVATAAPASPYATTYSPQPQAIRGFPDDEIPPVVAPGMQRDNLAGPQPPPAPRPAGSGSTIIVPVVPVQPVGGTPAGRGGTPPPTTTGRGGGGGR